MMMTNPNEHIASMNCSDGESEKIVEKGIVGMVLLSIVFEGISTRVGDKKRTTMVTSKTELRFK